jgi:hypothetical protein
VFDAVLDYWRPHSGRDLGETKLADWEQAVEFMVRIGMADTEIPASQLFSNEFLP